jgi:uncharacterized protein
MKTFSALIVSLLFSCAALAIEVPYLSGRVTDNAEVLSAAAKERITNALKAHEEATGNQVAVLTILSLDSGTVEDFATRVFESWKLGQKGKDNGVLLLVAPNDRRLRIEVGYGLEGTLTDVTSSRIIRNVITPRFKQNDFDGGIEQGVNAIIGQLSGNPVAMPADEGEKTSAKLSDAFANGADMSLTERLLIGTFVFSIIGLFTVVGVFTPGVGWFLYFFLIPFWAMFPLIIVGGKATLGLLTTYLIGFPAAKLYLRNRPWYLKAAQDLKTKGTANIGGFVVSSSGGSSRGGFSSSSSSGGFSGGGGSSGGGGASGSW